MECKCKEKSRVEWKRKGHEYEPQCFSLVALSWLIEKKTWNCSIDNHVLDIKMQLQVRERLTEVVAIM